MVTEIAPVTLQYSHTIGRQEVRNGNGFFQPVAITRGEDNLLYVLSRGTETPAFFPCKRVTVFTVDEELIRDFGQKVPPEDATREACLAKIYAADMVLKVTDNALQTLGGHGYIRDHPVELWLRNGRGFSTFEGLAMI